MVSKVHFSSAQTEWETPQSLFAELNKEFKFCIDLACTKSNCKVLFTDWDYNKSPSGLFNDSLETSWTDAICQYHNLVSLGSDNHIEKCAWLNPPYKEMKQWVKKCYEEMMKGAKIVMLIPARTDTSYWHDYIFPYAKEIRFLRGRIKFQGAKTSAPFPSAIIVWEKSKETDKNVISN